MNELKALRTGCTLDLTLIISGIRIENELIFVNDKEFPLVIEQYCQCYQKFSDVKLVVIFLIDVTDVISCNYHPMLHLYTKTIYFLLYVDNSLFAKCRNSVTVDHQL